MKKLEICDSWPDSWKYCYPYDCLEIWGDTSHKGYAYAYRNREKFTLDLIRESLSPGASILDIAAAQGNFTLALAESGYKLTWNDLREDLEGYVRLKWDHGDIEFAPGNAFELGFNKHFDCVLITEIIEHVAHPDEFLRKVSTMVKAGGYIVMSTPNGRYFRNNLPRFSDCSDPSQYESVQFKPNSDGHIFLLWKDEVEELAKRTGLVLEKHLVFSNALTSGHIKLEKVLKVCPGKIVDWAEKVSQKLPFGLNEIVCAHSATRFRKV